MTKAEDVEMDEVPVEEEVAEEEVVEEASEEVEQVSAEDSAPAGEDAEVEMEAEEEVIAEEAVEGEEATEEAAEEEPATEEAVEGETEATPETATEETPEGEEEESAASAPAAKKPKLLTATKPAPKVAPKPAFVEEVDDETEAAAAGGAFGLNDFDSTVNAVVCQQGGSWTLSNVSAGPLRLLSAGARASVAVVGGRMLFEVALLGGKKAVAHSEAKHLLRVGFASEDVALLGMPGTCGFQMDGGCLEECKPVRNCPVTPGTRRTVDEGDVLGVLINLRSDAAEDKTGTMSLFINGQRVSKPVKLPADMAEKPLVPVVNVRGATAIVNCTATPWCPLPFKVTMLGQASGDAIVAMPAERPVDGKYDMLLPVGVPHEGLFDWADEMHKQKPGLVEVSGRCLLNWATVSGYPAPAGKTTLDAPDIGEATNKELRDRDGLKRHMIRLAAAFKRDVLVLELRSNLLPEWRKEVTTAFNGGAFRRVCRVAMGTPPAEFVAAQREMQLEALRKKQKPAKEGEEPEEIKLPEDFLFRTMPVPEILDSALGKDLGKWKLPTAEEGFDEVAYDWGDEAATTAYFGEWLQSRKMLVKRTDIAPSAWFRQKLDGWLNSKLTWRRLHSKVKADIDKAKKAKEVEAAKKKKEKQKKIEEKKKAAQEKAKEKEAKKVKAARAKLTRDRQRAAKRRAYEAKVKTREQKMVLWEKRKKAAEEKSEDFTEEPPPEIEELVEEVSEEEKEEEEEEEVEVEEEEEEEEEPAEEPAEAPKAPVDAPDVWECEDITNAGNGEPLFMHWDLEDWTLLNLRFELHLLCHAFQHDLDDASSKIHKSFLSYYYDLYYKRQFVTRQYGCSDTDELLQMIEDTVELQRSGCLGNVHGMDTPFTIFVKLTEEARRERAMRVEAGDESARLSFAQPAASALRVSSTVKANTQKLTTAAGKAAPKAAAAGRHSAPATKPAAHVAWGSMRQQQQMPQYQQYNPIFRQQGMAAGMSSGLAWGSALKRGQQMFNDPSKRFRPY